jgi:dCMP deaminase
MRITEQLWVTELERMAARGTCRKRRVGALILDGDRLVLAAANGPPAGGPSCLDGGCVRCAASTQFKHGLMYDLCICLHAEQAALVTAAKEGISVDGCLLITSYQPCIMCAKLILGAGIAGVRYVEAWRVPEKESGLVGLLAEYESLWRRLPLGCKPLPIAWACKKRSR